MGRARGHLLAVANGGPERRRRGPYKWAPERIEAGLKAFLGERADWPTGDQFRAAGRHDLLDAVMSSGSEGR